MHRLNENAKILFSAVMRRLLVIANAVARDRQPWKLTIA